MATKIKIAAKKTAVAKKQTKVAEPQEKRYSKTWEAAMKYQGSITVYDPNFM